MSIILDSPGTKFARATGTISLTAAAEVLLTAHVWLAAPSAVKDAMPSLSIGVSGDKPGMSLLIDSTMSPAPWGAKIYTTTTASSRSGNGSGSVVPASTWYLTRGRLLWDGNDNPAVIHLPDDSTGATSPRTTDAPPFSFNQIDVGLDQPAAGGRQADGLKVAYVGVFLITGADTDEIATRRNAVLAALKTSRPQAVSGTGVTLVAADTFIDGDRDPVGLPFTVNGSAVVDGDGPELGGGGGAVVSSTIFFG